MFRIYFDWLFDNNLKSEIPQDLLKYNSPITQTFAIKCFMMNGKFNQYLDEYFNNMGLYYLDKKELFLFLKRMVMSLKIKRNSIPFIPYKRRSKLFDKLRERFPLYKNNDLLLMEEIIDDSDNKDIIYTTLGIDKDSSGIKKIKSKKIEPVKREKIKDFILKHFETVEG